MKLICTNTIQMIELDSVQEMKEKLNVKASLPSKAKRGLTKFYAYRRHDFV